MYLAAAAFLAIAFCAITVIIPMKFPDLFRGLIDRIRDRLVGKSEAAIVEPLAGSGVVSGLRWWGALSLIAFVALGFLDGRLTVEHPVAVIASVSYMLLAGGAAATVVLLVAALRSILPSLRTLDVFRRGGLFAVWLVDCLHPNRRLRENLRKRISRSSKVCIVDVTGYELLGKGPGDAGAFLFSLLDQARHVPVYIALCKPDPDCIDPERRKVSVLQGLLGEMNMSHSTYLRRVSMTMDAVEVLNQSRDENAKISVRFYTEKPTFRAILLDNSCVAIPFHPREERARLAYVDILRSAIHPTLYESFRRHFGRLWGVPAQEQKRRRMLPERAVSGSFAIRPVRDTTPSSIPEL